MNNLKNRSTSDAFIARAWIDGYYLEAIRLNLAEQIYDNILNGLRYPALYRFIWNENDPIFASDVNSIIFYDIVSATLRKPDDINTHNSNDLGSFICPDLLIIKNAPGWYISKYAKVYDQEEVLICGLFRVITKYQQSFKFDGIPNKYGDKKEFKELYNEYNEFIINIYELEYIENIELQKTFVTDELSKKAAFIAENPEEITKAEEIKSLDDMPDDDFIY